MLAKSQSVNKLIPIW